MLRETTVKNGKLAGVPAADPRITVYKGIPFAAPPVGDLRWRPPQPAKNWDGVLQADRFAPISVQDTPGLGGPDALYDKEWHVDSKIPMSEDCLYLNVWTPAKSADEKLPVMFWIFGGGLQWGYPSEMEFDGERIARRGIVFVSVNYRLNIFGFLSHPEITAENPDNPANFGLLDQRAGMQWVRENIAAFGGDPDNVTIFGQSAGGGSVLAHLTSPMSKGLFHKAIPQSSGGIAPGFSSNIPNLKLAEKFGNGFFDFIGVKSLQEARGMDARELLSKANEYPMLEGMLFKWGMVLDGKFLARKPIDAILAGELHPVPIMTGNTADEFDGIFELGNLLWAHKNAELRANTMYLYRFNPPMPGDNSGSFHSSELWFTFETLAKCWRPFKGRHYDLARLMCNYWTNFAKNGDPNGADADGTPMPEWTPYTKDCPCSMHFDLDPKMSAAAPPELMKSVFEYDFNNMKRD